MGLRNPELVVPVEEDDEEDEPAKIAVDVLEPEEPEPLVFCATACAGLLPPVFAVELLPLPLLLLACATRVPADTLPLAGVELSEDPSELIGVMFQMPVP